jgi:hypothetical protein
MRIVRICFKTAEQEGLNEIVWAPPPPPYTISIYKDDRLALSEIQRSSFAPALTLLIEPKKGNVIAIKVYSALGRCAGISGIGFVYDTGVESTLGSTYNIASLVFFIDKAEHLVQITVFTLQGRISCLSSTGRLREASFTFTFKPKIVHYDSRKKEWYYPSDAPRSSL